MTPKEIADALRVNIGKRLRITFSDGIVQCVDVGSVDEEGFVHSGPNGDQPDNFWTRFEDVMLVESKLIH
jgi:hypothetical protein